MYFDSHNFISCIYYGSHRHNSVLSMRPATGSHPPLINLFFLIFISTLMLYRYANEAMHTFFECFTTISTLFLTKYRYTSLHTPLNAISTLALTKHRWTLHAISTPVHTKMCASLHVIPSPSLTKNIFTHHSTHLTPFLPQFSRNVDARTFRQ